MAYIKTEKTVPVPPTDIWDTISGCELKLNREETKIIFLLLGSVVPRASGKAGQHAMKLFKKINEAISKDEPWRPLDDMNLKLTPSERAWNEMNDVVFKIVDRVTREPQ